MKKHGFTLIELLIVMLIISIVAGIVAVTVHTNQRKQFEAMGIQLVNTFNLAESEAMLRPATVGLAINVNTFQFYVLQQNKKTGKTMWTAIDTPALGLHHIPDSTQLTLKMNGKIIPASSQPQIIISPSNDVTPFVILIGKKQETPYYRVMGKANGEVIGEVIASE